MGRLLFWLVLGVLGWAWWKSKARAAMRGRQAPPSGRASAPGTSGAPAGPAAEPMVACVACGVMFPASEAVHDDAGRPYCSAAHRQHGPGR